MDRREFLGRTAGTLAAMSVLISRPGETRAVPPSDQINLGGIGVGSRGKEVMRMMLRVPGVRVQGLCAVYDPRRPEGAKIRNEGPPIARDYRHLLDRGNL